MDPNDEFLDCYYVLAHDRIPQTTVNTLTRTGVPKERICLVLSDDCPNSEEIYSWVRGEGFSYTTFYREEYLHDPYDSLVSEEWLRQHFPKTATPARRYISSMEHTYYKENGVYRCYGVFDDDVTMHWTNPWRASTSEDLMWDYSVWRRARLALSIEKVWSCHFVMPYTWGASYKEGVEAMWRDLSLFVRKGQSSAQSIWILRNDENHHWLSPVVEDYSTTTFYASLGRFSYCLNEYGNVRGSNLSGAIWKDGDPTDRDGKANQLAALRVLGVAYQEKGSKPYKKFIRYMFPHIIEKETDK